MWRDKTDVSHSAGVLFFLTEFLGVPLRCLEMIVPI